MEAFSHIPLGAPIPDCPHAVSCSLPTMAAVRGYEEKDPEVTRRLATGYPRFVVHPFAKRLTEALAGRHGLGGRTLWLTSSAKMADALLAHLSAAGIQGAAPFAQSAVHGVSHGPSAEAARIAKLYLQNIGGFMSSREAEDRLAELGLGPVPGAEELFKGDAAAEIRRVLRPLFAGAGDADLILSNCGMNAVHAAFRAVSEVQAKRGRTAWVQLGWLYLDTIALLKNHTPGKSDYIHVAQVTAIDALRRVLEEQGHRIAGIMAEIPTNPLVQTPDVREMAALCRRHGVMLVLDPSLVSSYSVDCLPYADLICTSLTKYTASDGDIIAGLVAVNPAAPDAKALRAAALAAVEKPYARDMARLAAQIGHTPDVLARIEESTPKVAACLSSHPAVRSVHWALEPSSRESYLRIARSPGATGGIISFSVRGPLEAFYDRLRLPKGPSFGMRTTLICPFMFLAHYDLVTTDEGRAQLRANGLDPNLLRLCVGTEPSDEIIGVLAEALDGL